MCVDMFLPDCFNIDVFFKKERYFHLGLEWSLMCHWDKIVHQTKLEQINITWFWITVMLYNANSAIFSYVMTRSINILWNNDEVLEQQASLDFYCASSLKQQSADRHVGLLYTLSWFRAKQSLLFILILPA